MSRYRYRRFRRVHERQTRHGGKKNKNTVLPSTGEHGNYIVFLNSDESSPHDSRLRWYVWTARKGAFSGSLPVLALLSTSRWNVCENELLRDPAPIFKRTPSKSRRGNDGLCCLFSPPCTTSTRANVCQYFEISVFPSVLSSLIFMREHVPL